MEESKDLGVTRALLAAWQYPLTDRRKETSLEDGQGQRVFPVPEKTAAYHYYIPEEGFLHGSLHLNGASVTQ